MADQELAKIVRQAQESLNAAVRLATQHGLKCEMTTSEYQMGLSYKDSTDTRDKHRATAVWVKCWRHCRDD